MLTCQYCANLQECIEDANLNGCEYNTDFEGELYCRSFKRKEAKNISNTREKLIGLLKSAYKTSFNAPYFSEHELEPLANHLIANGVTVQEWIPVTERPPEVASKHKSYRHSYTKSIRVLCTCVQKDGKKMVKEGYCEFWDDYPEPIWKIPGTIDSVTHWAYLPEPPKGD